MTRAQLAKTVRDARHTAALLRQPGFHRLNQSERDRIAGLLDTLTRAADRLLGVSATPVLHDQASEPDATEADLWGGAA